MIIMPDLENKPILHLKPYFPIVISAFPASGKTFAFKQQDKCAFRIADSDSSNFSWTKDGNRNPEFPKNYIEHVKYLMNLPEDERPDFIFVSSHESVRNELIEQGIEFVICYPSIELKDEWIRRIMSRGSGQMFADFITDHFETFINDIEKLKDNPLVNLYKFEDDDESVSDIVVLMGEFLGYNMKEFNTMGE